LCLFIGGHSFAQNVKDTSLDKANTKFEFQIEFGVNLTSYYSDSFFNQIFNKTNSSQPVFISSTYQVDSGSTRPKEYYSPKNLINPIGMLEISLPISNHPSLFESFVIGYSGLKNNYSYTTAYQESKGGSPPAWTNIEDTVYSNYSLKSIVLGYQLKYKHKCIFASIGFDCDLSFIKTEQKKREQRDDWWLNEMTNQVVHTYSGFSVTDSTYKFTFANFPFRFGFGGIINTRKIQIIPAFHFTPYTLFFSPYFPKGYNCYSISLGVRLP
jgi:hypothetical protein